MATTSAPTPAENTGPDNPAPSQASLVATNQGDTLAPSGVSEPQAATASPQPRDVAPPTTAGASDTEPIYEIASFQPNPSFAHSPSGVLKDGRVRNPVPSKLKGKTDQKKGNFSVMHMELKGKELALERDAAAKRTSESTELAAKLAFQNGYVSLRRSRFHDIPEDPQPYNPAAHLVGAPGAPPSYSAPRQPLMSADIKADQARLLTLLRSISPHLVVDQICKALAFFGGIPGAPPPVDGRFPESEKSNGSGALFVGWIAEIFPNLGGNGPPASSSVASAPVYLGTERPSFGEKRPRGRPKGSKASKFRSDKGIKKGPKRQLIDLTGDPSQDDRGDDSWIDVEDGPEDGTPARSSNPFHVGDITASGRKRGRPKGSRNRPKDGEEGTSAPISTPIPESGLFSLRRKKGRPKGSKNKPKDLAPQGSSDALAADGDEESTLQPVASTASAAQDTVPPESNSSRSQPTSFQPVNTGLSNSQPPQASSSPAVDSPQTSKKRKRKGKDSESATDSTPKNVTSTAQSTTTGTRNNVNNAAVQNRVSQTPIPIPVIPHISAPHAAKRQRKSKDPKSTSAKNQATSVSASSTQLAVASQADHQAERYTSPTIEELEAQLEEHAAFSPPPPPAIAAAPAPASRPQQVQQRNEQRQTKSTRSQKQRQGQTASPNLNQLNTASPHLSSIQTASPSHGHVHSVSPSLGQQQASKSNTPNSATPQPQQQQARNSQTYYSQTRGGQPQYGQQSQQQQQATQAQQYSTQPQKSQFTQQQQQTYSPQQQPQYSAQQNKQQSYNSQSTSQRYSSQQPQYNSYNTSSANSTPQTLAQQSPQFAASNASSFSSNDGNFRTGSATGMNYNSSSFGSLRTTTASPSDNTYRGAANNYGGSTRQSSSYGSGRTPLPSTTSGHSSVQGVQSLPNNLQGFQNFTDLSSFDMSNLDTSGNSGLGLNAASYNLGTGNVSRGSSNAGSSYATSAMTNFDTNLGGNDRYYVGRR